MSTTPTYPASDPFTGTTTLDAPDQKSTSARIQDVKAKAADTVQDVKTKAADIGRTAATKIDQNLDTAAGFLERSALRLRSRSGQQGDWSTSTAGRLESTASYLRSHHTTDVVSDLDRTVRSNPSASVAACFGLGFLIGMAIRRND